MVRGFENTKVKKNPWKTRMERDIKLHRDIAEAYTQGGKALGDLLKSRKKTKKK